MRGSLEAPAVRVGAETGRGPDADGARRPRVPVGSLLGMELDSHIIAEKTE